MKKVLKFVLFAMIGAVAFGVSHAHMPVVPSDAEKTEHISSLDAKAFEEGRAEWISVWNGDCRDLGFVLYSSKRVQVIGNKSALPSDDLFSLSGIYNAVRKAVASVLRYVGMWAPEAKAQKMVTVETQDEYLATAITNLSLKSVGRGITTNIRTSSGQSVWISNGFKDRVNESREGNIRMSETLTRLAQLVRDISPEQCRIKAHLQELQQKALQKKALQKGQS